MTKQAKAKLRAMPRIELERKLQRARDNGRIRMFWRYYFELSLRELEKTLAG
jgi:hypothetical protein